MLENIYVISSNLQLT